jgi:hypothetical protein
VTEEIAKLLASYRLSKVEGDKYGALWVIDSFSKLDIRYTQSERDRSAIYLDCLPLFTSGRARLIDNARMVSQFSALERRTFATGRDRIDPGRHGHDDACNSAAGALVLAASKPKFDSTYSWVSGPEVGDWNAQRFARYVASGGRIRW